MEVVISKFECGIGPHEYNLFGNGHIHQTYSVKNGTGEFLLQEVNANVFPDVAGMMRNIQRVTSHLAGFFERNTSLNQETLTVIKTLDQRDYLRDEDGRYWRMFDFKSHLKSVDVPENNDQIYEGARSYGYFLNALADFEADTLNTTISNFHNLASRLNQLNEAVMGSDDLMSGNGKEEYDFAMAHAEILLQIWILEEKRLVELRVTHNDTKFNNVLLDENDRGRCVIDLDTVMPGIVHYDFGDGIRTTASTASEDETDLQIVGLDRERYQAFAEGYLTATSGTLSKTEKQFLPLSGAYMAFIMGVRFLTDHFNGNVYYKVKHEDHNIDRARNQFRLTKEIIDQQKDLLV